MPFAGPRSASIRSASRTIVTVKVGELFWTPPMVDHAMVFTQDTEFLTFGRNSRAQAVYEADVVRIPPINP